MYLANNSDGDTATPTHHENRGQSEYYSRKSKKVGGLRNPSQAVVNQRGSSHRWSEWLPLQSLNRTNGERVRLMPSAENSLPKSIHLSHRPDATEKVIENDQEELCICINYTARSRDVSGLMDKTVNIILPSNGSRINLLCTRLGQCVFHRQYLEQHTWEGGFYEIWVGTV